MALGPDGLLYVLDPGNNRVVRFTAGGVFQSDFPLAPGNTAVTALAISATGRLYTGAVIATLAPTGVNPDPPGSGHAQLLLDGRGYIYLYDQATGMHVFSDAASGLTDLAVTKSGPATITAGTNITYNVSVTNNGPNDAQSVTLSDTLPAGTTFVSEAQNSGPTFTCTNPAVGGTGSVSCTIPMLASGATATFTLVFHVNANATSGSTITNIATISYPGSDPIPGNNSASTQATVNASANLAITKSGLATVVPGNNITYAITLTNNGPSDAQSVALTDALPANTTFVSEAQNSGPTFTCANPALGGTGSVSCTIATLGSGASATFTLVFHVGASFSAAALTNSVNVSSSTPDPTPGNNSASSVAVGPNGQTIVSVSDSVAPVGHSYIIGMVVQGSKVLLATVFEAYDSPLYTGTSLFFTKVFDVIDVSIHIDEQSPVAVFPQDTNRVFYVGGDFDLRLWTYQRSPPLRTFVQLGADNSGQKALATTPSGEVYVSAATGISLYPDANTATPTVTFGVSGPGALATQGGAMALGPDGLLYVLDPGNNRVVRFTAGGVFHSDFPLAPGITTAVTALAISANGRLYTANNAGGGTVYDTATGTIIGAFASLGGTPDLSGSASLLLDGRGYLYLYDQATGMHVFSDPASATTDLAVTKSGPATVTGGTEITYNVSVTNNGPNAAQSVTVNDALPPGTTFVSEAQNSGPTFTCTNPAVGSAGSVSCTIATLASGATATFTLVFHVNANATSGSTITNVATVSYPGGDPISGNNSASMQATVNTSANLAVTKSGPAAIAAGSNITYSVTVTNNGPSDAQSVTLTDALPANTTFVSEAQNSGPTFTCANPPVGGTGSVSCTIATFTAGTTATLTLVFRVNASATSGSTITNIATVSSLTSDPATGNNSQSSSATVNASADLAVTKSGPATIAAGSNITYSVTVTNNGPSDAQSVALTDALPANTTFVSEMQTAGPSFNCTNPPGGATGSVSCTIATLGSGASATFTLVFKVNTNTPNNSMITNTASASSSTSDPTPGNNVASPMTTVLSSPNVSGTKTKAGGNTPASTVTYTVVLSNSSTSAQLDNPGNEFIDVLPSELTLVSANATSGTAMATIGTNTVSWNGSIAANGSVTITITATINSGTALQTITNQGTINYDADGNGTNEASRMTDDPSVGGASDPTSFTVVSPANVSGTKTKAGGNTPGSTVTYTVVLSNSSTSAQLDNPGNEFTDVLPSGLTLVSASATSGTATATTGTNTVSWNGSIAGNGSVSITITATINSGTALQTISNQGTISYDADGNGTNEASRVTDDPSVGGASDPTSFTVVSPANVSGTKTKAGGSTPGSAVTYTVVLSTGGSFAQLDNPGNEFTDVLPSGLTLVSASATSGTATAAANTVSWNGSIAANSSVTITITATINNVPHGTVVSNQGTISYDADGNGTNEASRVTDDPAVGGASDPTTFAVVSRPDLTITKSHAGNFFQGQTGASYTITVTNSSTGPTSGPVMVTDVVPVGLTPTGPNGVVNGWSCAINGQTLTCTRSDVLAGGASYPDIILTVNVANPAPLTVTNTASNPTTITCSER